MHECRLFRLVALSRFLPACGFFAVLLNGVNEVCKRFPTIVWDQGQIVTGPAVDPRSFARLLARPQVWGGGVGGGVHVWEGPLPDHGPVFSAALQGLPKIVVMAVSLSSVRLGCVRRARCGVVPVVVPRSH